MNERRLIIGTRGSQLALWQANHIAGVLAEKSACHTDIRIIKTRGDKIDHLAFDKMEGKGFFTRELEDSLLTGEIDIAVHSLKDLMTSMPDGLKLGAVGFRSDRREMLLMREGARVDDGRFPVRDGAVVGTSSARRQCQIAHMNDSLQIKDLRGNVPTRINKLRDGQYDAIVIAAAGVLRLGLDITDLEAITLDPEVFLPAPAQGILGVQIREDDTEVDRIVGQLDSPEARLEVALERGLLQRFDSGCSLPLGVVSSIDDGAYRLQAVLGVRGDSGWDAPLRSDITGNEPETVVAQSFDELTRRHVR